MTTLAACMLHLFPLVVVSSFSTTVPLSNPSSLHACRKFPAVVTRSDHDHQHLPKNLKRQTTRCDASTTEIQDIGFEEDAEQKPDIPYPVLDEGELYAGENTQSETSLDAFMDEDDLFLLHDISLPTTVIQEESDGLYNNNPSDEPLSLESLTNLTLLSSDLPYFFLRDELGLSEEAMWKITLEAGSTLGMTTKTIRKKVDTLRKGMGLSDEDIINLLQSQPTLLHLSADGNIKPKLQFLKETFKLSRRELKHLVISCPSVLSYSMDNLQTKIKFFRNDMKYTIKDLKKIVLKEPRLMAAGVKTGLKPRVRFLLREMEFPLDKVQKLCLLHPRILMMSLDANLRPKLIFFFILTLHMSQEEVLKILLKFPQILDYNLENHVRPIMQYFLTLDFSAHEGARMLLRNPRLVTHSLSKIKHVVGYLRYQLGLEAADVRRVLYQAPQVVGLTTDNLQNKVDYLETVAPSIHQLIVGMPTLLLLNVEMNLEPKVEYLTELMGEQEVRDSLRRLPTLLGYSLDNRIRPRLEAIIAAGVSPSALTVGIPMGAENFKGWLERRANKVRNAAEDAPVAENEDQEEEGRVKHWTRDRR